MKLSTFKFFSFELNKFVFVETSVEVKINMKKSTHRFLKSESDAMLPIFYNIFCGNLSTFSRMSKIFIAILKSRQMFNQAQYNMQCPYTNLILNHNLIYIYKAVNTKIALARDVSCRNHKEHYLG